MQPSDFYIFKIRFSVAPSHFSGDEPLRRGRFPPRYWGGGAEGAGARRATETEVALSPPIAAVKPGA